MPSLLVVGQQIKEIPQPEKWSTSCETMYNTKMACCKIINPISTGPFYLVLALTGGEVFFTLPPSVKFDLDKPRAVKLRGLIAYIMLYKICQFGNSVIRNGVIMTS